MDMDLSEHTENTTFPKSRKYHSVHHYQLRRHLQIHHFLSIQSVRKFIQTLVLGSCKEIKTCSISLNQEHFWNLSQAFCAPLIQHNNSRQWGSLMYQFTAVLCKIT